MLLDLLDRLNHVLQCSYLLKLLRLKVVINDLWNATDSDKSRVLERSTLIFLSLCSYLRPKKNIVVSGYLVLYIIGLHAVKKQILIFFYGYSQLRAQKSDVNTFVSPSIADISPTVTLSEDELPHVADHVRLSQDFFKTRRHRVAGNNNIFLALWNIPSHLMPHQSHAQYSHDHSTSIFTYFWSSCMIDASAASLTCPPAEAHPLIKKQNIVKLEQQSL